MCLKWKADWNSFERVHTSDFSLKNVQLWSPFGIDGTHTKTIIDSDCYSTIRNMAEKLNSLHACIEK